MLRLHNLKLARPNILAQAPHPGRVSPAVKTGDRSSKRCGRDGGSREQHSAARCGSARPGTRPRPGRKAGYGRRIGRGGPGRSCIGAVAALSGGRQMETPAGIPGVAPTGIHDMAAHLPPGSGAEAGAAPRGGAGRPSWRAIAGRPTVSPGSWSCWPGRSPMPPRTTPSRRLRRTSSRRPWPRPPRGPAPRARAAPERRPMPSGGVRVADAAEPAGDAAAAAIPERNSRI